MDRELAAFRKNDKEQVKVILSDFKGMRILNIRVYFLSKEGAWLPSKKGLAFAVEKLPILLAALHQAAQLIDGNEHVEPGAGTSDSNLLSEQERRELCEKFGLDLSEIDEIFV
jgi:transcriptional coactivator p15 (PC4)